MTIQEVKEVCKLIPTFVMMCENDLEEDEHKVAKPLTYAEYEKVSQLITKLKNCEDFVNLNIFE